MGGLLIAISIVVPTLLWADLSNRFVWIAVFSRPAPSRPSDSPTTTSKLFTGEIWDLLSKAKLGLQIADQHPDRGCLIAMQTRGHVFDQADGAVLQTVPS